MSTGTAAETGAVAVAVAVVSELEDDVLTREVVDSELDEDMIEVEMDVDSVDEDMEICERVGSSADIWYGTSQKNENEVQVIQSHNMT